MATRIVPPGQATLEERIQETVPYQLWFCPIFPIDLLGGRLDKDPELNPWLQGLHDDIKAEGKFRNPVFVWNHHPGRKTGKQPEYLLRAGSNRVWCAEQLNWTTVPVLLSMDEGELPPVLAVPFKPRELEVFLRDPGVCWANDSGFGLLQVDKPEETYAEITTSNLRKTTNHLRTRLDKIKDLV